MCAGNSPLYHSSRKHSESTPLSSPSSLLSVGAALATNPFATNYDSGNCDHWQSGGSGSSSGGQSPLLVNTCSSVSNTGRENGINSRIIVDDSKRNSATLLGYSQVGEMRNNLQIETTGLQDPNPEVPSPLSPKGLQFRHRPFPLSSSSLQSPIPRPGITVGGSTAPIIPVRNTPLPISKSSSSSLLQHDKYLSPFNSDLNHPHGHAHTHPHTHASTHRQLYRLRTHLSTPAVHRLQVKPAEQGCTPIEATKSFSTRLSVHSPLSKLAVSTSVEEYHCNNPATSTYYVEGRRGGNEGGMNRESSRRNIRKIKRRSSEASLDGRDESLMESDSSLAESCDEGIEMTTNTKQT